jgi:hypothetical protein
MYYYKFLEEVYDKLTINMYYHKFMINLLKGI